jgi:hypothetical protein
MKENIMRVVPGIQSDEITVYIQVPDRPEIIEVPEGAALGGELQSEIDKKLTDRMHVVGKAISSVCTTIYGSVEQAIQTVRPDEMTLEFGITLGGKTGVPFVTEGSAEGTFKVSATWKAISNNKKDKNASSQAVAPGTGHV